MMRTFNKLTMAGILGAIALSTPAFALTCTAGQTTFTLTAGTLGVINGSDYSGDSATACVSVSAGVVTVTLANNTTSITNVPNILDGFSFSLAGAAAGPMNITGVTGGFVDCNDSAGGVCASDPSFTMEKNSGEVTLTQPYGWGLTTTLATYGSFFPPQTFTTGNPALFAGCTDCDANNVGSNFSLHPGGIVNSGVLGQTVIGDAPHNDLLLGNVTFTLTCTACTTGETITNGVFYWGTDGAHGTTPGGSVPEPTSILLLGTALAFAGKLLAKRVSA